MNSQKLLDLITADRDAHISLLQAFTRAQSPNPPGDTRQAAGVIVQYLRSQGVEPEIVAPQPSMPNVVSDFECAAKGKRLLMNGHIDVFPAGDSSGWDHDPWSGDVVDRRLYGRGTVDMKAGTIASVVAYTYLFKYREQLGGSVALCAVSDEETGGKFGTRFLLEDERWRGDVMINAEPAGTSTIRFAEKGTLRLTFRVRTEGAHGAYTHKSESAILIAARLIEELGKVEDIVPEISPELREYMTREEVKRVVDECMGSGAADIMLKATLNIGVIRGGLKVNMIPSDCVFEADIRLPVGMSRIIAIKAIEEILEWYPQATVEIQEAASNPSTMCSYTHPMIDILARNAAKVMGKTPVAIPSLGATDCKFYRYRGIPAYIFGVSPESMASKNESIDIEEYLTVLKTHTLAGWEYLGGDMNKQAN